MFIRFSDFKNLGQELFRPLLYRMYNLWFVLGYSKKNPCLSRPKRLYCWLFIGKGWLRYFRRQVKSYQIDNRPELTRGEAKFQGKRQIDIAKRSSMKRITDYGFDGLEYGGE